MLTPQCLWLVRQPADMRAGITTLTRLATVAAGHPPRDGEAFLFTGKNRTRMKLLMWDRHGVWLCTRRLHRGTSPGRSRRNSSPGLPPVSTGSASLPGPFRHGLNNLSRQHDQNTISLLSGCSCPHLSSWQHEN